MIQLSNATGVKNATGITAVLSTSTPGVTITQPGTSAYADIPLNFDGGNNLTPFTFTVANNVPCALKINFTLTLTYTGGPAPTKALNFSVQTGVFPIAGNLGNQAQGVPPAVTFATGSQIDRLFRTGVPSSCPNEKPFPGTVTVGARTFDSFTFTAAQALCMNTVVTSVGGANLFTAAYSPNFVPSNLGSNFVGDAGSSGRPHVFSSRATATHTYTIVVSDSSPSGTAGGLPYTLLFPSCAITNPATVNHPPVALAQDVTVTAATVGGTAAANINNGSFDPDPGDTITITQTPPSPYPIGVTSVLLTVVDSKGATAQATANVTVLNPGPDLLIKKSHTGNFLPGQVGATYTITVSSTGTLPTSGTVTVVDMLPSALTTTAMVGTGWTCTVGTLTCTRADALATGSTYPPIALTVNVAAFPPASVTNTATVSGGGDVNANNNIANDPTTIIVNPDLTITSTHVGNFSQGQSNAVYTVTVTNSGTAATTGLVSFLDTLPAGLSFASIGPAPGWSCSTFGNETCERADSLAANSSFPPVTIVVAVAPNAPASGTNTVTVFGGGEVNTSNDTSTDATIVTPAPNLTIASTHPGNFSQGQVGVYTITVANIGFAPTTGLVTVTDQLPQGFTPTAMAGTGWTCTLATTICTRSDALAAAGSYPVITLTGNVGVTAPLNTQNTVIVSGGGEFFTADDGAVDPTTINQLVDMTVTSMHVGDFAPGQIGAVYTLVASNIGFSSSTAAVTVQDNLPGMTATAMTGPGWSCNVATVVCTRSDVLAGNSSYPPITLTVNVPSSVLSPELDNTVVVSGGGETNTQNDTGNDVTAISAVADMIILMSHVGNFFPGQGGATYSIIVSNSGRLATNGSAVTVRENLPAELTFTAISGLGWTCNVGMPCSRSDVLGSGASYPPLTLTVNVAATASGTVTSMATVSGGGETNNTNDTATDVTIIAPVADLTITKTHSGDFTQGQVGATYGITVTNSGAAPTSGNVMVADTLPTGLTPTAIAGTGRTCTLGTLTCTRGDVLAASASYPAITLTVTVANNAPASVTNTATVSGGGELVTTNDIATNPTVVTQLADLTITSSHSGNFSLGQSGATYAITATNSGAGASSGTVTVVDTLPAGLTATAISGAGWTCNLTTLSCTRNDVLAAATSYPAITITVNVTATTAGNVTNTATVSGGGEVITTNDTATDVTALIQDFAEASTTSSVTVTAGQTANFTITLTPGPGGFTNAISFFASGLPSASSPTFNPASLTPGSSATSTTLSIATTANGGVLPPNKPDQWTPSQLAMWSLALAAMIAVLLSFRRKRQTRFAPALSVAIVLLLAIIVAGCGGGGVGAPPPPPSGTPAGTSIITVTAASGSVVHTTNVTLIVQ